jgi:hypothetical protein
MHVMMVGAEEDVEAGVEGDVEGDAGEALKGFSSYSLEADTSVVVKYE